MASRGCKHPADAFRYVCGQFIKTRAKKYSVEASAKMCEAYKAYFGMPVGDQDKPWAPHFTCEHCKKTLEANSIMADKRQRVRIQGSWAGPARKPAPGLPAATGSGGRASLPCAVGSAWGGAERTFEFQQPTQVKRKVPEVVIMEKEGEFEISQGPSGVSRLRLIPSFLPVSEADWMFAQLLADLPWKQKSNLLHGESYEEPRLTCWFGELPYTYSHSTLQANTQWHPVLAELRQRMELASGHSFNSLLCNLYRDGKDSIAWHSDSEPSLRPRPTIGSLSLGDTRNFEMRKQPAAEEDGDYTYAERIRVPLSHGTLLLMEGAVQEDWQHRVPKEYHDRGPRINLTFRMIYPEPGPR
ncbi:alpha-ketoglutarate-dependent dioxygenase alkB homolog 3 isoform X2 [Acipenser ruthenus]|uniref:alpha-ketoglutarate-dependent dioxygenase alkB homolog 3 isoform X2 n=1 Tax=Acipenser ruthenus TaxID=7906 RepID=UPI00274264C7|nr:alpha-ketoglutarate-dependent dioxygenase alkB homolog 3 isoform X2 [Acipenser ruthenus]